MPTQRLEEKRVEERAGEGGREGRRERERMHAGERGRKRFGSCSYMVFPPPGPALCRLGQPGALFVLPGVFTLVLGPSFHLPCLLATAILDSFSLFYLPNIPLSRDGRPSSLAIGVSWSFWLLPAEQGQRWVLGLPLLLVSSLRVLIAVSI